MLGEVAYAIRKAQRTRGMLLIEPEQPGVSKVEGETTKTKEKTEKRETRDKRRTQVIPVCIICKGRLSDFEEKQGKALCRDCEKAIEAPYPPADEDYKKSRYRRNTGWQRYRQNRNREADFR